MNLSTNRARSTPAISSFGDCIEKKDYVGALANIEFGQVELTPIDKLQWIGYISSRLGGSTNYSRAKEAYLELLSDKFEDEDVPNITSIFLSIAYLNLRQFTNAEETILSATQDSELKTRILLHIAQKTKDESKLAKYRQQLSDSKEDKLSAAAVEFSFRHRYQDVVDVCKSILASNVDDLALYVYSAMALFKMGCHDQSLEALSIYSQAHPDSTIAANLKACSIFHLYNGNAALEVIDTHFDSKESEENDLVRHNVVAFTDGKKALQVLPGLVDKIPEAKLNLAMYYLKHREIEAATDLIGDMEADSPQSYLVLGILNTELAQLKGDLNAETKAKHHFQSMGQSSTECDTIPGRQCMASYFYLMNQFEDANFYLDSIKAYSEQDDDFNWNYGISLAANGHFKEGLEALLKLSGEPYKAELAYVLWLVKCHIMENHPEEAWECFLQTEDSNVSYEILQLIGNECYKNGGVQFLFSARSFHELHKMDSYPDYLNGLLGACVGYFRGVILSKWHNNGGLPKLDKSDSENLKEVIDILESLTVPNGRQIAGTLMAWAVQNQVLKSKRY
mmetsp:Transcript_13886/g.29763  ORF Transcript_13886/g.29763 Transcript_13886/m.29763 type:complete len:565 (+) Transcript_13886:128-1822(+)